jgi:hypothetical protein
MTTETNDSAQGGAQPQQEQPTGQAAGASPTPSPATPAIPAELQPVVDQVVADRLKRAREKWATEQQAKAKTDTDAAEAQRLKDEQKWEALARKHEARVGELDGQLKTTQSELERATSFITTMLDAKKKGLPEPMQRLLVDKGVFEQLEIVEAFLAAQPAAGQRAATPPTPQAQGGQSDYVKQAIERQAKRATGEDPFAAMMKR